MKEKQYCNEFNKGFENGPHQKKKKKILKKSLHAAMKIEDPKSCN